MNRTAIFFVALSLLGLLLVGLWSASNLQPPDVHAQATATPPPPPPVGVQLVAIDTTITGNDDTAIGPIDSCAGDLSVGDTLTFDLVILGVDDADRIAGYQVDIDYDPAVITVTSYIDVDEAGSDPPNDVTIISRIPSILGAGFLALSDVATNPGSMTLVALDGTDVPPWPDIHESGDGVLARVTVSAVGNGLTMLDIGGTAGGADGSPDTIIIPGRPPHAGSSLPIDEVRDGAIAVGQACPESLPTPTPTTEPTPTVTLTPTSTIPTPSRLPPLSPSPTPTPSFTPASATSSAGLPVGGVPDGAPGAFPATGGDGASGGSSVGWTLALLAGVSLLIVGTVAFAGARRRPG